MLFEKLQDDFNDSSLDTAKWVRVEAGSVTVNEQNQQIEMALPSAATSSAYGELSSVNQLSLKNSQLFIKTTATPSVGTNANAAMYAYLDANNWLRWVKEAGTLYAQINSAGSTTTLGSVSFNSVTHRWWRIREAAGTAYWDTAEDGQSWTNRFSFTHGLAVTRMKVLITAYCYQNETNPGSFKFDNLNILARPPASKQYTYKVFDASGNYLKTWDDVASDFGYPQEINSPASELVIRLARSPQDFGEEQDVKFNNIVKVYLRDREYVTPTLVFEGFIANYAPVFENPEQVEVVVLSFGAELNSYIHSADETANQSQATGSSTVSFGGGTTIAQSFVPSVTSLSSVVVKLSTTNPVNVTLSVQADGAGAPSGTTISGSTVVKQITSTTAATARFIFGTPITVSAGTTYWIVLQA